MLYKTCKGSWKCFLFVGKKLMIVNGMTPSFFLTVHGVCIKYMLLCMFVSNSAQGVIVISCASNGSLFLIICTYPPLVFPVRALE